MRQTIILALLFVFIITLPASAGRLTSTKITHIEQVYQAYVGSSQDCRVFLGYLGQGDDVISAVPGVLAIEPGVNWSNFIGTAQVTPTPIPYTIKNVSLVKRCPEYTQCNDRFPPMVITQQGTPNIRLWWPLMYERPSCTFTLSILYGTPVLWDDDGVGPNPPAWVHVEEWVWHVDTDLEHLSLLLELFHEIPFGLDEVLISDEPLYYELQGKIADAIAAYDAGDTATAAEILMDFELEVMDACIDESPAFPNPTGPGTGIANSEENPACCKLLVDVEYILQTTGIGQPKK